MSAAVIRPRSFDSNSFSPAGLHILVVDDDSLCLTVLERMLKKCNYRVTACTHAGNALELLRADRESYDLVLSDVYMPDIDGFKLLEIAGIELDLPVIMMSANCDTNVVMKGITHGACDYLIKPVRIEELKNIWQHVVRRRGTDHSAMAPSAAVHVAFNDSPQVESPHGSSGSSSSSCVKSSDGPSQSTACRKRKEAESFLRDTSSDDSDQSCNKKARVNWTVDLHQQFVCAVNQLGVEKAVPKRLLEILNVQGLTREHVASHLQKYRLYLKRLSGAVPEPCPIASFQASEDGMPGGTMCILPGGKNNNTAVKQSAASKSGRVSSIDNIKAYEEVNNKTKPRRTTSDPATVNGFVNPKQEFTCTPRGVQSSIGLNYYLQDQLDSLVGTSIRTHGTSGLLQDVACPSRSSSLESRSSQRKWNANSSVNHPINPMPEIRTSFGTGLNQFQNSNPLPSGYPIFNANGSVGFTEANYTKGNGGSASLTLDNIEAIYGVYHDSNLGQVPFPQAFSNENSPNMRLQKQTDSSTSSNVSSQFIGLEDFSRSLITPSVFLQEPDHASISMLQDALFLNGNLGFLAS